MIFAAVFWALAAYSTWYTWRAARSGVLRGRGIDLRREAEPAAFRGMLSFCAFGAVLMWIAAGAASFFIDQI